MTKLYEIAQEYSNVLEAITELFDDKPELDDAVKQVIIDENLSLLQHDFSIKALALAGYIQNLKLEQSNVKELQDKFAKRVKSLDRTISHLNEYLLMQMQQVNIPKLNNTWLSVSIRNNPAKVIVEDETLLSDEFKITEQVIKINKSLISEQLKAGGFIPYAHLESSQRLEIK
jgi:CRISPR/Cas system CMR subunit Cmr4 (Cas7 group RAMP superfamily)